MSRAASGAGRGERRRADRAARAGAKRESSRAARPGLDRLLSHNAVWIAVGLALLHVVLALLTFMPQPFTGGDNAAYVALGRSLLERGDYVSLYDPALPPHTQYPPAFPALLAIALALGFDTFTQLKFLVIALSAGAVAFTFLWIGRRHRPALAFGVALVLALSPGVLELTHWVLSDVPFWCFTMIALWGLERVRPELRGRFLIGTGAVVVAYFTRSAGLPLLLATLAWLVWRRRWKQLALLAGVSLPLAFLWWLRAQGAGGIDYVSQFWFVNPYDPSLGRIGPLDLVDRVAENASKYVRIHMPILLTGRTGGFALLLGVLTIVLAMYGWVRRLRRAGVAELFLPLYLGLIMIWPAVWSGERFLLPVLPLLLAFAGEGLVRLAHVAKAGAGLTAGAAAAAVLLLAMLPGQADAIRAGSQCTTEFRAGDRYACLPLAWRDWFAVAEWAQTALPADAVVLSRKPRLFYVVGGRRGRNYPMSPEPAELVRAADEAGARYIVLDHLDGLSQLYLLPAVVNRIQAFCLLYSSPMDGTVVLGVRREAATLPDVPPADANIAVEPCGPGYLEGSGR